MRARVRMGIPLEAVIEAYRTGMNVYWEECTAEVASLGLSRGAAVDLVEDDGLDAGQGLPRLRGEDEEE